MTPPVTSKPLSFRSCNLKPRPAQLFSHSWMYSLPNGSTEWLFPLTVAFTISLAPWDPIFITTKNGVPDNFPPRNVKRAAVITVCTCLYHEVKEEMLKAADSLVSLTQRGPGDTYTVRAIIVVDDAFRTAPGTKVRYLGPYGVSFLKVIETKFGQLACEKLYRSRRTTVYGMVMSAEIHAIGFVDCKAKPLQLTIMFKDTQVVRNRKRTSQLLYLQHVRYTATKDRERWKANGQDDANATFGEHVVVTTDGDTQYGWQQIRYLVHALESDPLIGGVCGRIEPDSSGMMSAARWWQEFEYAAGHWFTKAAQAITGSVACLPGAFSAYRLTALESVLPKYSTRHTTPSEFLMKEMGEDRWMCALLILEGWQLSYTSLARVKTCVPQSFEELFNQRRRWLPSSMVNTLLLLSSFKTLFPTGNGSPIYMGLTAVGLLGSMLSPAMILLMTLGALWGIVRIPFALSFLITFAGPMALWLQSHYFGFTGRGAWAFRKPAHLTTRGGASQAKEMERRRNRAQARLLFVLSVVHGGFMVFIMISVVVSIVRDVTGLAAIYFLTLISTFLIAALAHLKDALYVLPKGFVFLFGLPAAYFYLPVFAVQNLHVTSWGTRDESALPEMYLPGGGNHARLGHWSLVSITRDDKFDGRDLPEAVWLLSNAPSIFIRDENGKSRITLSMWGATSDVGAGASPTDSSRSRVSIGAATAADSSSTSNRGDGSGTEHLAQGVGVGNGTMDSTSLSAGSGGSSGEPSRAAVAFDCTKGIEEAFNLIQDTLAYVANSQVLKRGLSDLGAADEELAQIRALTAQDTAILHLNTVRIMMGALSQVLGASFTSSVMSSLVGSLSEIAGTLKRVMDGETHKLKSKSVRGASSKSPPELRRGSLQVRGRATAQANHNVGEVCNASRKCDSVRHACA